MNDFNGQVKEPVTKVSDVGQKPSLAKKERAGGAKRPVVISVFVKALIVICSLQIVFVLLLEASPLEGNWEVIIEPVLLVFSCAVLLYLFVVKPIQKLVGQLRKAEEGLQLSNLQLRAHQRELRDSEQKYKTFYESSRDAIMVFNSKKTFVNCNQATLTLFGFSKESELIGRSPDDLSPQYQPDGQLSRVKSEQMFGKAMETGSCFFEWRHKRAKGEEFDATVLLTMMELKGERFIQATVRDITIRKRAEDRLKQLSQVVEQSREGIALADMDEHLTFVNKAFAEMHGYSPDELFGEPIRVLHTPEQMLFVEAALKQMRETGSFDGEIWHVRKDGSVFLSEMHNIFLRDDAGNSIGTIGIFSDITERKKTEKALEKALQELETRVEQRTTELASANEELREEIKERKEVEKALREVEWRFRTVFENTVIGLYRTTPDGRILLANPTLVKMLGFSSFEELVQRNLEEEGFEPGYPRQFFKEEVEKEGKVVGLESVWIRRDGTRFFVNESAVAIKDKEGKTLYYEGTLEDITERKKAEEQLLVYQEQLRRLASELSLSEERLRRRVATEVHDRVGQNLAISKIKLESLRKRTELCECSDILDEVCDLISETIQSARFLTFELSPPVLYELGFEAAVEWLVRQTRERHGIDAEFESDGKVKLLEDNIRVLLFQAVRELLVNVVKHAQASFAKVSVKRDRNNIMINVEDNGVGFDVSKVYAEAVDIGGFGFFSIRERLSYIGGNVEINSTLGQGTCIKLEAPIKTETSRKKEEE